MKPIRISDFFNVDTFNLAKDLLETVFNLKLETYQTERDLGIDFVQRNKDNDGIDLVVEIKVGKLRNKEAIDFAERYLQIMNSIQPSRFILLDFEFVEDDFKELLQKFVLEKSEKPINLEILDISWIMEVVESNKELKKKWLPDKNSKKEINYWLLKMNAATWNVKDLKVSDPTYFSGYYFNDKRKEYERLNRVQPGDLVLGYAFGMTRGLVGIMEVTDPLVQDVAQGEIIRMQVKELFQPFVSFHLIQKQFPDMTEMLEKTSTPPELFFDLTPGWYNQLVSLRDQVSLQQGKSFIPFFLAEGDHQETQDQLDFENDINSLASIISLKKINPPLAIGLFGNWGSGKSFFMEKLESQIKAISESHDELYVENVVQVKFNSWHYSDANLWASLITEIFDSLKKYAEEKKKGHQIINLQRTLLVTSQEKEIIEEKKRKLEKEVVKLEQEQQKKRDDLEDITGVKLLKLILSDKQVQKDLEVLSNPNVKSTLENKEKVEQYIDELKNTRNQIKFLWNEIWSWKGKKRWYTVGAVVLMIAAIPILNAAFPELWEAISLQVKVAVGIIVPVLTHLMETIRPVLNSIGEAKEKMNSLKQTLESRDQAENPNLARKQQQIKQLQEEIQSLDADIAKAKDSLREIQSGRRLLKFIDERSADQEYRNALGVISAVRKDFQTLDKLLREQHVLSEEDKKKVDNPEDVQLNIERIVLYIDDLDRCNKEVVVRVLEAIHLLLAFPLFVVIVGVDPRWLNNALSDKYRNLFGQKEAPGKLGELQKQLFTPGAASLNGAATSYDYLEKIFQIPFAIKPVNQAGREKLIQYLFRNETASATTRAPEPATPGKAPDLDNPTPSKVPGEDQTAPDKEKTERTGTITKLEEKLKKNRESLVITPEELSYMQKISPLFGKTPRTINRYVNIYRIIRTHGSLKIDDDYDKDEFMPIMFLLAVIVGHSDQAEKLISGIRVSADNETLNDFLGNAGFPKVFEALLRDQGTDILSVPMEYLKRNIDLISRFSFRTLLNSGD